MYKRQTDCLLQHGAAKVFAIDVGYGQLAWSIRSDPRVVTMERTNIRYVKPGDLGQIMCMDVSDIYLASAVSTLERELRHKGYEYPLNGNFL